MRLLLWLRSTRQPVGRKPSQVRPTRLGVFAVEDRVTPDARDIAGLRFNAPGTFAGSSSNATISTAVEVGLVPVGAATFVPLLSLPGGVAVTASPASAKVNSTLSARGLTFTGNNLAFSFDQPNNKFSIAGDASFTAGGVTIGASFGSALGTPGLVIQGGKLASVDLAVTTSFSYGSVSFNTQDLRLELDTGTATSTRYAVSGKATATVAGQSSPITLTTQFGESAAKPGLKVVNGQLTELDVQVNGGFSVAGLSARATDLRFTCNRQFDQDGLSGGLSVSTAPVPGGKRVLDNFAVQLGSRSSPRLVVQNGQLQRLDFALNGTVNLGPLQIKPQNLWVQFTRATGVLQFTGKLTASLGSKFNASGDLTNGGLVVNTTTRAVQLDGIRLTVFDTRLGPVNIREAFIESKSNPSGSFDLSGGAIVDFPAGLTVGGTFQFTNATMQRVTLFVEKDPGLPLGDTGVFVRRVDASPQQPEHPECAATVRVGHVHRRPVGQDRHPQRVAGPGDRRREPRLGGEHAEVRRHRERGRRLHPAGEGVDYLLLQPGRPEAGVGRRVRRGEPVQRLPEGHAEPERQPGSDLVQRPAGRPHPRHRPPRSPLPRCRFRFRGARRRQKAAWGSPRPASAARNSRRSKSAAC